MVDEPLRPIAGGESDETANVTSHGYIPPR
jgi:hypothetical protein